MSDTGVTTSRNGIQVIARAAAVLRALKGSQTGMSLGQIAEQVSLPRSTVQRIVGALQAERLVIASSSGSGVRLGPELHALAESARYTVVETVRPLLLDLSRDTEETVDLSVMRGSNMIFLDQIPGTQRLRAVSAVGDIFPITTTANGKACLATMDDGAIAKLVEEEWERNGTTRNFADLMEEIREIRRSGVAFDRDEHTDGICAVGIAFSDWKGDRYAISVPIPTNRFAENSGKVVEAVKRFRRQITAMMAR
ncbi:MAG: IclR family transcriptional regulator [Rhodobiaceae bacterium]|nr:IclR family transcriptional regulator [Rhodobiaceae bacterium]